MRFTGARCKNLPPRRKKFKMSDKAKKISKKLIALIVAAVILSVLGLTVLGFFIGFWVADSSAYIWTPDYAMMSESELREIYEKPELDDGDYDVLFAQTGLTKLGIDRARAESGGWLKVSRIHKSYFAKREVNQELYAPLVCTDYMEGDKAVFCHLERGDIIISSSTHFSGFRIGHSAIVTNSSGRIYQSNQVGISNGYSTVDSMFADRINFMVLRINPEYFSDSGADDAQYRDNLDRVTQYIETSFNDVPYSVFTGVFTKKDSMQGTSCSHLLWYGFKHFDDDNGGRFNLDLDSNGRLLVLPKNISQSPYVELVQTFGFDPEKMYE